MYVASAYRLTGLSIADTSNPIKTRHQINGRGTVYNTVLAVPSHLNQGSPVPGDAPWNSVEHVEIPPVDEAGQVSSVGEHVQGTDEIYYIYQGEGRLTTNGAPLMVGPGTLVIAPRGTRHTIENLSSDHTLAFLVIELHAPAAAGTYQPTVIAPVPERYRESEVFPVGLRVAGINLADYFAAPWGLLSLIEVPPGAAIDEYTDPVHDENLFVVAGRATIFVAGERIDPPEQDGAHRNVVVPWGVPRRIVNSSESDTLTLLSVCVRRKVDGMTRRDEALAIEA